MLQTHKRILLGLVTLLFVLTPILYTPSTYLVFDLPKVCFFQAWVELLFAVWLFGKLIFSQKIISIDKTSIITFVLLGVVLLTSLLACLLAYSPNQAFWGNYFRREGFLLLCHFILLFIVIRDLGKKHSKIILGSIVAGVMGVVLFAVLELFSIPVYSTWKSQRAYAGRLVSTFGQPNLTADYMGMAFPLLFFFLLQARKKYKVLLGFATVLCLFVFLGTEARGSFLALLLISLAGIIMFLALSKLSNKQKILISLSLILGMLTLGIIGLMYFSQDPAQSWRVGELLHPEFWYRTERFQIWNRAIELFKGRPWLGYGQDNFELVFPGSLRASDGHLQSIYVDRTHNMYLESLINTGVIGTSAYLGFVFYLLIARLRTLRQEQRSYLLLIGCLVLSALFYLARGFSNINEVALDAVFWTLLALISTNITKDKPKIAISLPRIRLADSSVKFLPLVITAITVSAALLGIRLNLNSFLADIHYKLGLNHSSLFQTTAISHYEKAVKYYPYAEMYRLKLVDDAIQLGLQTADLQQKVSWYQKALYTLEQGDSRGHESADYNHRYSELYETARELIDPDWEYWAAHYAELAASQAPYKFPYEHNK